MERQDPGSARLRASAGDARREDCTHSSRAPLAFPEADALAEAIRDEAEAIFCRTNDLIAI